jgi:hypothetical protein
MAFQTRKSYYEPNRLKVEMNISLTAINIDFQNKKEEREKNKKEEKTIVETLIGYIDEFGVELFQNTNKEPYARVPVDNEHHANNVNINKVSRFQEMAKFEILRGHWKGCVSNHYKRCYMYYRSKSHLTTKQDI